MIRNEACPICGSTTDSLLDLSFGKKMMLPTEPGIRYCASDNFLFLTDCDQSAYDEYYASVANDTVHAELSGSGQASPISKLQRKKLVEALGAFFDQPRNVLDFGCGEGQLLMELGAAFPGSRFRGFDPGPAAKVGSRRAAERGLENLKIAGFAETAENGPFDLVILSHVLEHLVDFDLLQFLHDQLTAGGLMYIEVPNSLRYEEHGREEFLYYFDRLHVNHFTPQSIARLASPFGLEYLEHFEYAFPYRRSGDYPALGVLLRAGDASPAISSSSILESAARYIKQEAARAEAIRDRLSSFEGVLVWGTGDNFHRSVGNGGPLSGLRNMVLLDRREQDVLIEGKTYRTMDPLGGVRELPWPVAVTVSEGAGLIRDQVHAVAPNRQVFFV